MPDNILKAVISVTAPGAQQAFQGIQDGAKKTEGSLVAMKGSIDSADISLKEQKAILASLQKQYASLSTEQARSSFGKELSADIKVANSEIKRLEAGATSSFGAIGGAATKGFSAIRQLAYVLPGIGIAGIFSAAFTGVETLVDGIFSVSNAFNLAAVQAEVFKDALKSSVGETSTLQSLVAVARDVSLSTNQRTNAIKELQKEYPDYLRNISLENINSAATSKAINSLTNSILQKALVEAYASRITAETIKQQERQDKLNDAIAAKQKKQAEVVPTSPAVGSTGGILKLAQVSEIDSDIENQTAALNEENDAIDKLKKKMNEAQAAALAFVSTPKPDTAGIKRYQKAIDEAIKSAIRFKELIRSALEGIKFEVPPEDIYKNASQAGDLFVKDIQDYFGKPVPIDFSINLAVIQQAKIDRAGANLGAEFSYYFNQAVQQGLSKGLSIDDAIKRGVKLTEISKQLDDIINGFAGNLFSAVGDSLGEALSGAGSGISSIVGVMSALLKQIGEALIKYGIVKTGLDKILGPGGIVIPGAVAIGLGIFAVAASALLKSQKLPGRAAGGPVSAGVTYIVGENGPEVFTPNVGGNIIPNHALGGSARGIAGVGDKMLQGTLTADGTKLVAMITLVNQSNSRLS